MRRVFRKDRKRINHHNRVVRFAEEILNGEGCDLAVVIAASYLHDIGIHEVTFQTSMGRGLAKALLPDKLNNHS